MKPKQLLHFVLHLRLHYQFFILSGGYLLGGYLSDAMISQQFWLQFINVHVLLFGGATAYNSWWDKDEGAIGGLKHPPKMEKWMHSVSLLFMFSGWVWSVFIGLEYALVYGASLLFFWLYSTPHARWKGKPLLSLVAIGVSTGFNSVLLGLWASGGAFSTAVLLSAVGASMILLSLYPVSQIFQIDEDHSRGDETFTAYYGLENTKRFFVISYVIGLSLLSFGIFLSEGVIGAVLFILGSFSFLIIRRMINPMEGLKAEYKNVMKTKFFASLSFVLFLMAAGTVKHSWLSLIF